MVGIGGRPCDKCGRTPPFMPMTPDPPICSLNAAHPAVLCEPCYGELISLTFAWLGINQAAAIYWAGRHWEARDGGLFPV